MSITIKTSSWSWETQVWCCTSHYINLFVSVTNVKCLSGVQRKKWRRNKGQLVWCLNLYVCVGGNQYCQPNLQGKKIGSELWNKYWENRICKSPIKSSKRHKEFLSTTYNKQTGFPWWHHLCQPANCLAYKKVRPMGNNLSTQLAFWHLKIPDQNSSNKGITIIQIMPSDNLQRGR